MVYVLFACIWLYSMILVIGIIAGPWLQADRAPIEPPLTMAELMSEFREEDPVDDDDDFPKEWERFEHGIAKRYRGADVLILHSNHKMVYVSGPGRLASFPAPSLDTAMKIADSYLKGPQGQKGEA